MKYLKYLILACMLITLSSCAICGIQSSSFEKERDYRSIKVNGNYIVFGPEYKHLSKKELKELHRADVNKSK